MSNHENPDPNLCIQTGVAHFRDAIRGLDDDFPDALVEELEETIAKAERVRDGINQVSTPEGNFVRDSGEP